MSENVRNSNERPLRRCCGWLRRSARYVVHNIMRAGPKPLTGASISTGAMVLRTAHGHRLRNLCSRTRAYLQPRHLQFSSCRGFRSRPQRMSTNSVAGGLRPEPVGSSAWDDLSAWRSSVSIGSSESIAQITNLQQPKTSPNHPFAPLILLSAAHC